MESNNGKGANKSVLSSLIHAKESISKNIPIKKDNIAKNAEQTIIYLLKVGLSNSNISFLPSILPFKLSRLTIWGSIIKHSP